MKLALAFAVVAALIPGMSNQDPAPPAPARPTITLSPIPPRQGGELKIMYDGKLPVTLELDWDPAGTPTSITIPAGGSATVTVPSNASSLIVRDPSPGGADAAATVVNP